MNKKNDQKVESGPGQLIRCATCSHFSHFDNDAGHNSPHTLGKCKVKSWDGNRGQWAMFQHNCKNFMKLATP